MGKFKVLNFLLFASFTSFQFETAKAEVSLNSKTGNLTQTSNDNSMLTEFADQEFSYLLTRIYRSRTLHNDKFGFGWCSPLETHFVTEKNGKKTLEKCEQSTDQGLIRRFDSQGRLIFLKTESNVEYHLLYRNGVLQKITNAKNKSLLVRVSLRTGKIRQLILLPNINLCFTYRNEDLIEVKNFKKIIWSYKYDLAHNLIQTRHFSNLEFLASYDPLKDKVIQLQRQIISQHQLSGPRKIKNFSGPTTGVNHENY